MHAPQRLLADESLQTLDAESELAQGQRALVTQTASPQTRKVLIGGVVRTIDNPQILASPAFHGGLGQTSTAAHDEIVRLDHHALAAPAP
jgi:hypothetical protein